MPIHVLPTSPSALQHLIAKLLHRQGMPADSRAEVASLRGKIHLFRQAIQQLHLRVHDLTAEVDTAKISLGAEKAALEGELLAAASASRSDADWWRKLALLLDLRLHSAQGDVGMDATYRSLVEEIMQHGSADGTAQLLATLVGHLSGLLQRERAAVQQLQGEHAGMLRELVQAAAARVTAEQQRTEAAAAHAAAEGQAAAKVERLRAEAREAKRGLENARRLLAEESAARRTAEASLAGAQAALRDARNAALPDAGSRPHAHLI
jgi:hypothetical protein